MEKQRISFFVYKKQFEDLKALSRVTRVRISDYLREGIDMVLARYKKELKKGSRKP